jgi:hypothetical protein
LATLESTESPAVSKSALHYAALQIPAQSRNFNHLRSHEVCLPLSRARVFVAKVLIRRQPAAHRGVIGHALALTDAMQGVVCGGQFLADRVPMVWL